MLFVFEEPKIRSFWMKDMSFPIDIIWVDEGLEIVGIEKRISPNTYPKTFESLFISKLFFVRRESSAHLTVLLAASIV